MYNFLNLDHDNPNQLRSHDSDYSASVSIILVLIILRSNYSKLFLMARHTPSPTRP